MMQVREPVPGRFVPVRRVLLGIDKAALDLAQLAVAVEDELERRAFTRGRFLPDVGEYPRWRQLDRTRLGQELAADQCEEARFAGAVRSDDADLLAGVHGERGVLEQALAAARERE